MNTMFDEMLNKYELLNRTDKNNAVKEIIQEMVLCGLSRTGFFDNAVFYGGTALRIFYGLDRFSEDLDFSLRQIDKNFNLEDYFPVLEKEIQSMGLKMEIQSKEKSKESDIKSAFLKGNTVEHMMLFRSTDEFINGINPKEMIKINIEIDTNPPDFATFENKFNLLPMPYQVGVYDMPSLFAGKLHAVICRGYKNKSWQNRVKGRDLYDFVFYMKHNTILNLKHLNARLIQSGFCNEALTVEGIKICLNDRFDSIDYKQAKEDVLPFVRYSSMLDLWSADFFKAIASNLKG